LNAARQAGDASHRAVGADAIVVAAGASRRMGGLDKLAAPIGDRPVLAWTLAALANAPEVERIVVVVAPGGVAALRAAPWLPAKVRIVVEGGDRRQASVAAGLAAFVALDEANDAGNAGDAGDAGHAGGNPSGTAGGRAGVPSSAADERVLLVHDGARPAISATLVGAVVRAAATYGAAIPVVPLVETIKRVEGGLVVGTEDRSALAVAQTPQGMRRGLLRAALASYPADGLQTWTDEASLLEACRIPVHAIPGDPANLKVTTPDDLGRVEAVLLGPRRPRIGFGEDGHPFGPGEPLALGGIAIEGSPRLYGHSDGDVALHAVADALLGAAGLGDLGRVFPAGPMTPAGIDSADLVREVVRRLAAAGFRPSSVDLTIVAARPRLGDRLVAMGEAIAPLLGLPAERVNVKASSGNLLGVEGAGRAITARAVALVEEAK
jgi:2-C-methyl-D-erythritol 4-phosphate cytidylyltransferase/2-C-methyl-D-erythritol 2,4-cyclodiphosphate synthase